MIIYCNGDSFTAGDELGDNIIPGYPGLRDYNNSSIDEQTQIWINRTWNDSDDLGKFRTRHYEQIQNLMRQRSWPGKLADQTGFKYIPLVIHATRDVDNIENPSTPVVINSAESGSSMDRIARTTISHLIKLLDTTNDIIVFIGLPPENRYEVGWNKQQWHCVSPQHSHQHEDFKPLNKFKLTQESDYHMCFNFFKNIIYINDFCKVNKLKLYYIPRRYSLYLNGNLLEKHSDLKRMVAYADVQPLLEMDLIAKQIHTGVFSPGQHYSEIVYEYVAKEICTWLKL